MAEQNNATGMPPRTAAQAVGELLDWVLTSALILALLLGTAGGLSQGTLGVRWSQAALLYATVGGFAGATVGFIGWAVRVVQRRKGLLLGLPAGVLAGLLASVVFWVVAEPIKNQIAQAPERLLTSLGRGLESWIGVLPKLALVETVVALALGLIMRIRDSAAMPGRTS